MFRKISEKIGFTQSEIKVLLFLLAAFAVGYSYKTWVKSKENTALRKFNYEKVDSLFNTAGTDTGFFKNNGKIKNKTVDYKQEVLDFNKTNSGKSKQNIILANKSINLNKAGIEELSRLPGIGEKTAEKILTLRSTLGRFKKLEELLEVKGIGNKKFNNIKKYIFIE